MAFSLCCPEQADTRRQDSWGGNGEDDDDDEDGNDEDSVATKIDACLRRPWRLRRKVATVFRKYAERLGEDSGRGVSFQHIDKMLGELSDRLRLPEDKIFSNWQQLHERFDFSGDQSLDKYECLKLVKYVLRQRRVELKGRVSEISVPQATLQGEGYQVVRELGRGGQGVMYMCTKSMDTRKYCVKFYDKANANACGLNELIDEYALMKTLANEHIARTYEVFQDNSFYYLVNEPYFGGDLTKLAKKAHEQGLPMSEDWWRPIFRQCLEGLAYLHRKAIMHCDIKEPNVMIATGDSYVAPRPVLIDFGLSTGFSNKVGGISGTPGYIPPETWETGIWYPLGDVFSMGVVFFQLMVGQVPSATGSVLGVLQPMANIDVLRNAGLAAQFPWQRFPQDMPELANLVAYMLQRDRKLRLRAPQALNHVWFQSDSDADLPATTLKGLLGGGAVQLSMDQIIDNLCKEHNLEELRKIRAEIDITDSGEEQVNSSCSDGPMSKKVSKRLKGLKGLLTKQSYLLKMLNLTEEKDMKGNMRMRHILDEAIWAKQHYSSQYIRDLFAELDTNTSGVLSAEELSVLLDSDDFECHFDDIEELLEEMGADKDGMVTFENFSRCVLEDGRISHRSSVEGSKKKCVLM